MYIQDIIAGPRPTNYNNIHQTKCNKLLQILCNNNNKKQTKQKTKQENKKQKHKTQKKNNDYKIKTIFFSSRRLFQTKQKTKIN